MKENIKLCDNIYKLTVDYNEAYNEEEVVLKYTDYFENYDYIVGDIAYGKLRLKGFNKKDNKNFNSINDFKKIDEYIKNNCAFGCKHFILEKIQK